MSGFIERPSPNCDARPEGAAIDILVLHYTGMKSAEEALARLCDPAARVSAHYTIDEDGRIYRHVDEVLRAWHAGVSWWAGERNVNGRSIGIELVNPGHEFGYVQFPDPQIEALADLARTILARHPISPHRVLGHSDVAPARKQDPGELFPWSRLAEQGIGVFPPPHARNRITFLPRACAGEGDREAVEGAFLADEKPPPPLRGTSPGKAGGGKDWTGALRKFGYGVPPDVDIPLATVVTAFQRHFRPEQVDGMADEETQARLYALLKLIE